MLENLLLCDWCGELENEIPVVISRDTFIWIIKTFNEQKSSRWYIRFEIQPNRPRTFSRHPHNTFETALYYTVPSAKNPIIQNHREDSRWVRWGGGSNEQVLLLWGSNEGPEGDGHSTNAKLLAQKSMFWRKVINGLCEAGLPGIAETNYQNQVDTNFQANSWWRLRKNLYKKNTWRQKPRKFKLRSIERKYSFPAGSINSTVVDLVDHPIATTSLRK